MMWLGITLDLSGNLGLFDSHRRRVAEDPVHAQGDMRGRRQGAGHEYGHVLQTALRGRLPLQRLLQQGGRHVQKHKYCPC